MFHISLNIDTDLMRLFFQIEGTNVYSHSQRQKVAWRHTTKWKEKSSTFESCEIQKGIVFVNVIFHFCSQVVTN